MKASSVFLHCVLSAAVALVSLGSIASALAARPQKTTAADPMNGVWFNVDPATRGLVRLEIMGEKIHPFGACHPDPCDWGVIKAKAFAASVDSPNVSALLARQDSGFKKSELTLTLEPGRRLRVEVFTHFTDGSGRADYRSIDYFTQGRPLYTP